MRRILDLQPAEIVYILAYILHAAVCFDSGYFKLWAVGEVWDCILYAYIADAHTGIYCSLQFNRPYSQFRISLVGDELELQTLSERPQGQVTIATH